MRALITSLVVVVGLVLATPVARGLGPTSYLKIDGRWYTVESGAEIEFFGESAALAITATSASNCQRSGGGVPPLGSYTLYYGPTLTPLQMTGDFSIVELAQGQSGLVLTTSTGDVVCAGDVPAPSAPIPPEPPLFVDGFEQAAE